MTDDSSVISLLNQYDLWRLITGQSVDGNGNELFTFEVWLNTVTDKDGLFNDLKPIVDQYGEAIDWHECSHDEPVNTPCVITEEYRGVM